VTATLAYGPQADRIEALLTAVRELTPARIQDFCPPAWPTAAWGAARSAAWHAACRAERPAEWHAAWAAAFPASHAMPLFMLWPEVWDAARDAVAALAVLDLVGQYDLTRGHIDVLTAPLLEVMPGLAYLFEPVDIAETEPRS
jgi:hypothetical protein